MKRNIEQQTTVLTIVRCGSARHCATDAVARSGSTAREGVGFSQAPQVEL